MSRRLMVVCLTTALLSAGATAPVASAQPREVGDTSVFTRIGEPGTPEGIAVHEGIVYVGTSAPVKGNAGQGPSKIFRYDVDTARPIGEISIAGQALDEDHGLLGMAVHADGHLYVLDQNPPRLLRFDLGERDLGSGGGGGPPVPVQETYATFPDLPPCLPRQLVTAAACSATLTDNAPYPNSLTFDVEGNAYVTDFEQGSIFRIPSGGDPQLWFTDTRLDGPLGPNGIAVDPDGTRLYFAMTASLQPTNAGDGMVYTLPLGSGRPTSDDLEVFHTFDGLLIAPDGIVFGASGHLYVALAGRNQISILGPDAEEVLRFPDGQSNEEQDVPYDTPASVAFDGKGSILVTNQSAVDADPEHWAVLESFVDDLAMPHHL